MNGQQRRDDVGVGFPPVMRGNQIGSPSAGDMTMRSELATIGVLWQIFYIHSLQKVSAGMQACPNSVYEYSPLFNRAYSIGYCRVSVGIWTKV